MNGLTKRLERLEAEVPAAKSCPHIRQWLGIPLTDEERDWIEANPLQPMTEAEKEEFDEWWDNHSRAARKR